MWTKVILTSITLHLTLTSKIPHPSEFKNIKPAWDDPSLSQLFDSYPDILDARRPPQLGRIINGLSADLDQFPFAVMLLTKNGDNDTLVCGGSLIKMNWILTAAHCLAGKTEGFIFAGAVDMKNGTIAWRGKFNQSQMFIHPEYLFDQYVNNDIALIKIPSRIPCNKHIGVIDLPCSCDELDFVDGLEVTTMGFGQTNGTVADVSLNMRFIEVEIMETCKCKKMFPFPIFDSMICTSTMSGMSSCMGDSGSALVAEIKGRKVQIGVVSFGNRKCATGSDYPVVFVRISSYLDWILGILYSN
ncbi:unnamed protein product [Chironomus riparius]|uniref:Peptidase S1 domain-containing protein n=1 Tax=Chironomus riparius TaxID=315576 RepID=A0A9N9S938_9DIPT|nr:unnamed protein product [Chironomus riparius]